MSFATLAVAAGITTTFPLALHLLERRTPPQRRLRRAG